jgi:hypothetical protein
VLRASSLHTEQFSRRRVNGIHIPWTLVRYVHMPLSTPIERAVQTAVRRLLALVCLGGIAALNIQRLVYRPSMNALTSPSSPGTATHIDDVDTLASDSSSSPSWDESKVVALQSIGATMSDFPQVEDVRWIAWLRSHSHNFPHFTICSLIPFCSQYHSFLPYYFRYSLLRLTFVVA